MARMRSQEKFPPYHTGMIWTSAGRRMDKKWAITEEERRSKRRAITETGSRWPPLPSLQALWSQFLAALLEKLLPCFQSESKEQWLGIQMGWWQNAGDGRWALAIRLPPSTPVAQDKCFRQPHGWASPEEPHPSSVSLWSTLKEQVAFRHWHDALNLLGTDGIFPGGDRHFPTLPESLLNVIDISPFPQGKGVLLNVSY